MRSHQGSLPSPARENVEGERWGFAFDAAPPSPLRGASPARGGSDSRRFCDGQRTRCPFPCEAGEGAEGGRGRFAFIAAPPSPLRGASPARGGSDSRRFCDRPRTRRSFPCAAGEGAEGGGGDARTCLPVQAMPLSPLHEIGACYGVPIFAPARNRAPRKRPPPARRCTAPASPAGCLDRPRSSSCSALR